MEPKNRPSSHPWTVDPKVGRAEVRKLRLPMREALNAAHGPTAGAYRELTVVALVSADGVTGWGECAALGVDGYWHETASSAFEGLAGLVDGLPDRTAYDLTQPSAVIGLDPSRRPMTAAAVEMAALDLLLKVEERSLADHLGSGESSVPAGAAVGLGPADAVAGRVSELAAEGYRRVKVKIEPETAPEVVAAVVARLADRFELDARGIHGFELHVDPNGAYPGGSGGEAVDGKVLGGLVDLARLGVRAVEQPFAADDEAAAAALRSALIDGDLPTLVLADEAATTLASARRIFATGAADGVVVKPARLGGLESARTAINTLAADGAAVAVGGMVESALGRHSLAAIAALDGVSVIGDLSPARRWLRDDPWPDVATTDVDGALHVVVPRTAGVAPPPDPDKIARFTVEKVSTDR